MRKLFWKIWHWLSGLFRSEKATGSAGEQAAAQRLREEGFSILERNWRWRKFEIDIIAEKKKLLLFAEVKTRSTKRDVDPRSLVNAKKRTFLKRAAKAYLRKNSLHERLYRFDVFIVRKEPAGKTSITVFEDFFKITQ